MPIASSKIVKFTFLMLSFAIMPLVANAGTPGRGSGSVSGQINSNRVYTKPVINSVPLLQFSPRVASTKASTQPFHSAGNSHEPNLHPKRGDVRAYNRNLIPGSFVNNGYVYQPRSYYQTSEPVYSNGFTHSAAHPNTDYVFPRYVAAPKLIYVEAVKKRHLKSGDSMPKVVHGNNSIITDYNETYQPNIVRVRVLKD